MTNEATTFVSPSSTNPWLACPNGVEPGMLGRRLRDARELFDTTGDVPSLVRPVVRDSWLRSKSLIPPQRHPLPRLALVGDDLEAARAATPLAATMPVVQRLLVEDAVDAGLVVGVVDVSGRLLWVDGASRARDQAAKVCFVPGAVWDEESAGTNAPALSITHDHAVQVFGAEHYLPDVRAFSCAAAPLHDPVTGAILGAVDVTGGDDVAAPQALLLVRSAAAAIQAELALQARDGNGSQVLADPPPTLFVLGRDRGVLRTGATDVILSLRHTELLLCLAERPEESSAEQLDVALHPSDGSLVTVRAELSRLRRLPHGPAVASRPYRLTSPLRTDVGIVRGLLAAGRVAEALAAWKGPVLPQSEAPLVVDLREELSARLRAAALGSRDAGLALSWARGSEARYDVAAWEAVRCLHAAGTEGACEADAQLRRLARELAPAIR